MISAGKKLLFLLFFAGAVSAAAADRPEVAADSLQRGIAFYEAGQTAEALTSLRSFVVRNSDSPLLPQGYLYLARIFVAGNQSAEALHYLDKLAEDDLPPAMHLLKGVATVQSGQVAAGIALLTAQEPEKLTIADRLLRLTWLAHGHATLGRPLPALLALQDALALSATNGEELLQKAHALLRVLSDAELEEAIQRFTGTTMGDAARRQKAERALTGSDRSPARQLTIQSEVREEGGEPAFLSRQGTTRFLDRLLGHDRVERAVGVILPLSGRYAAFGKQVQRGMELAQLVRGGHGVRFLFIDADGEATKSAQTVTDLVTRERVIAIAGPLTGAAATAAAASAQQEQVPLLTLSQREGLPELGNFIFRDALTSHMQVQALVEHAMRVQQLTNFAILHPENKMGREMADLFAAEVVRRGGKVTDRQSYAENITDFRQQVRLLQRRNPLVADDPDKATPKVHFQALFIPDYAERIGLIAPQLVFYGIEEIQLLGLNGWNSPTLLRLAANFVEGALFVDGFYLHSPKPAVNEFVNLFMEKYGEEPSILDAQGFDAAGILLSLLKDQTIESREQLRQALAGVRNYPGVTGTSSFNAVGEAEKILFLLQVSDGAIIQVN